MSETLNAQDIAKKLQEQLTSLSATVDTHEVSTVDEVGDGIARVSGLKSAMAGELLEFKSSDTGETVFGLAQNLDRDEVGAVLFGAVDAIKEGDECRTTGRIMDIPVSRAMLGRVPAMPSETTAKVQHALAGELRQQRFQCRPFACGGKPLLGTGHMAVLLEKYAVIVFVFFQKSTSPACFLHGNTSVLRRQACAAGLFCAGEGLFCAACSGALAAAGRGVYHKDAAAG